MADEILHHHTGAVVFSASALMTRTSFIGAQFHVAVARNQAMHQRELAVPPICIPADLDEAGVADIVLASPLTASALLLSGALP
ncbi:MAG: hypothetical protein KC620_16480 [Myxococcales bacterium]|nr:hypothetical protein [Myxococcales bacterium]